MLEKSSTLAIEGDPRPGDCDLVDSLDDWSAEVDALGAFRRDRHVSRHDVSEAVDQLWYQLIPRYGDEDDVEAKALVLPQAIDLVLKSA